MKNFIENNFKWIVRIFVILWLFLIAKLWYFWLYSYCWTGWYINICVIPSYKYFWTNAWYISIAFLMVSILITIWIYFIKNKTKKVLLAFIILFLWIIGKSVFYYLSPDFKFYYTDEYLSYMDKDFHPKNIDLYLEYMWKYCNSYESNFNYKNLGRDSMCGWKYLYDFKTVEDYKKVFDFANKNNMRELYRLTYIWAEDFWLEKIIKGYRDDAFYGYIINGSSNIYYLNFILKNSNNNEIKLVVKKYIEDINYFFNNAGILNHELWEKYWENLYKENNNKLKQIKTINTKVF